MTVYISELARPTERVRLVDILGFLIAIGFCLVNWISYVCSFARLGIYLICHCCRDLLPLAYRTATATLCQGVTSFATLRPK